MQWEYEQPFEGWDFSYIADRRLTVSENTWDCDELIVPVMKSSRSVLDVDTGGGEQMRKLLNATEYRGRACATEGYEPNVATAKRQLEPLGVEVIEVTNHAEMPFEDGTFDLIVNRHGAFSLSEEHRLLSPGGAFLTQQVGEQTNQEILELFEQPFPPPPHDRFDYGNLDRARAEAQEAGFHVDFADEAVTFRRFLDSGALAY